MEIEADENKFKVLFTSNVQLNSTDYYLLVIFAFPMLHFGPILVENGFVSSFS